MTLSIETINKAVHKAIGKCWHEWGDIQTPIGDEYGCIHCGDMSMDNCRPDYCTNTNEAFHFVEFCRVKWLNENPDETQFWRLTDCCSHGWRVDIEWGHHDGDIPVADAVDTSLAKAICLAGLSALSISLDPGRKASAPTKP
jgi:hypothetical protein